MILLSLHCRNSEALRCSVLQTGSVVYGSLSITSFESVINQSELCVQILDACLTHARKHHRDPCRLSFTQRACSQATIVIMSQSIPWLPIPPPGRLSGIFNCTCSQGRAFAFCWLAPGWGICSAVKSRIFVACFAI